MQVYEAFFLMATRNFKAAATLFLEAIATFTTCVAWPPSCIRIFDLAWRAHAAVNALVASHTAYCVCQRTELFSFERCIFYTVITSLVSLDRMTLKTKVCNLRHRLGAMQQCSRNSPARCAGASAAHGV